MALVDQFMTLDQLDVGVVKTFHPTEAELVGFFLYNKISMASNPGNHIQTFPEICIYGETGLPPWEIWRVYQQFKFPHQDFLYFFSWAKKVSPNKSRNSRTVGSDGGTWSETEAGRPVYISGSEEAFGKVRKFRYEKNKDKTFVHHAAWLMEEYTINQAPDLALCRLKVNDKGGGRKKRKKSSDETNEDQNVRSKKCLKNRKVEPRRDQTNFLDPEEQQEGSASFATTTSQLILSPYHHEDDQAVQVVPENNYDYDELQQILFSDDDCMDENLMFSPTILFDDAQLMASVDQSIASEQQQQQDSDYSLAPQQQLEPDNRCQGEDQIQQQQDQPSSSHSHEQQLLIGDGDLMIYGQHNDFLWSDEFNGLLTHEDQLGAVPWRDSDDQFQYSDIL
ncbi:NAC domain-containing protein 71-like [Rosa chinensis]|uniref:NAC domain-containing protein 71-like n=1 Tax=Rosa chinensis TaxID=74649 RepID=UPI000D09254C|nr:NAC domain-containing protein 71-like [Rosa chinensis]